jgi:pimeloyl-ACP methyl ester carboxylesterase
VPLDPLLRELPAALRAVQDDLRVLRRIAGDGLTLAVQDEGDGPAVLLLHGFPDSHRLWRTQVPALTEAGFRTIAPDLRGFGESDIPETVEEHAIVRSAADMAAVLDALEIERAHVVGHDWGAVVAWAIAAYQPQRVERLAVLSVGHPNTFRTRSLEQRQKSWYMLLFQFDFAEELLRQDAWKLFREWTAEAPDLERYLEDLSRPGRLEAGLDWYRANARPERELGEQRPFPAVAAPTLGLWSTGDRYLTEEPMLRSAEHVTGGWRYERIEGASHWLQLDAPDQVNALLLEFLTE